MNRTLLALLLITVQAVSSHGQGAILIQHSGATDPTTEGFALGVSGSGTTILGPATNDLGVNAWMVGGGNVIEYSSSLTPIPNQDWTLSIDLRVIQSGGGNGAAPNNWVLLDAGGEFYGLHFGADSNGNATVWINNVLTSPGSWAPLTLSGRGSVYNNFQLVYDSVADSATLWANGTEGVGGITGTPAFSGWEIYWGAGQAGPSQANWNLVSLSVPEPSSVGIILFGGGVLLFVRRRRRVRR